jgi:hypothetical protein
MTSWFDRLIWAAFGLSLVTMTIFATDTLPPAAAALRAGLAALPDGWTFPAGCLSW